MQNPRLKSLQDKHQKLEESIRCESNHATRDTALIEQMKKEKLILKEEIERVQTGA